MAPTRASSTRRCAEINIANNAELCANSQSILAIIRESRPKNTTGAYKSKQKEFKLFCKKKQYQDDDTVTEDKLLLFLVEKIANQPLRMKSRKTGSDVLQDET